MCSCVFYLQKDPKPGPVLDKRLRGKEGQLRPHVVVSRAPSQQSHQSSPDERCHCPAWTQTHSSAVKPRSKGTQTNACVSNRPVISLQTPQVYPFNPSTWLHPTPLHSLTAHGWGCQASGAQAPSQHGVQAVGSSRVGEHRTCTVHSLCALVHAHRDVEPLQLLLQHLQIRVHEAQLQAHLFSHLLVRGYSVQGKEGDRCALAGHSSCQ